MDSELQIALIAAGVAAVGLIVGYNKWQEGKHRRRAEAFKSEHRDVLLEPRASTIGTEPAVPDSVAGERAEPSFNARSIDPEAGEAQEFRETSIKRRLPLPPAMIAVRTDCIILLEAIELLDVQLLWTAQKEILADISKPVRWFGFSDIDNQWQQLGPDSVATCHWFCAAMQLVDRRGAITEADFNAFAAGVQRVADQFLAVLSSLPQRMDVLRKAAELDSLCADIDIQVAVNVVALGEGSFEGERIASLARAQGMELATDGRFHARDAQGNTLFTLSDFNAGSNESSGPKRMQTNGLSLLVDVPCVANGVETFDLMMRAANALAQGLRGQIVDDNRQPFDVDAAALVRTQIARFQERMASEGIPAGRELIRRLFAC